jgi:hypothetical protein
MGFIRDLTGKTAVNAAKKSGNLLTDAALEGAQLQSQGFLDSSGTSSDAAMRASQQQGQGFIDSSNTTSDAALRASQQQSQGFLDAGNTGASYARMAANQQAQGFGNANAAQMQNSNRASAMFDPFAQLGQSGVNQAGFLTDPNQQFNFLQNNPLFQMGLDNANRQTMSNAASQGRLSSGDTLQQLTNNSLLTAQPLIQDQKNSIANLLNFGTNAATNQGNILLGQGQNTANSINNAAGAQAQGILSSGNAMADARLGSANSLAQGTLNSGNAMAAGQSGFSNSLAQGILNVGNATAAGQFGSANALADGVTNAANARATGIIGEANARGQKAQNTLELGGDIAQALYSSDPQLKTNIVKTGKQNGFNIYTWDWNELASKLGLTGKGAGVMADEVKAVMPEAVITEQGYMKVNYSMIGVNV